MYTLFTRGKPISSTDPADIVDSLYQGKNYLSMNDDEKFIARVQVAEHYRTTAQAYAISLYPLQTLMGLTIIEQKLLYHPDPQVFSWNHLPPLVLVRKPENDNINGGIIDGIDTIQWIDATTDESLLNSLDKCGVIKLV